MNDTATFPQATAADWRALVEKTLKGQPLESLNRTTFEGLPIAPLYVGDEALPAQFPQRAVDADRPWDIRADVSHPDPSRANADLLADLEGGAASGLITIDPTGTHGIAVGSAADLATVLNGVVLELAPIAIDAGFLGPQAADWLATAAKGSPTAKLAFHLDPLSAFAQAGQSPGPMSGHIAAAAAIAARLADIHPQAGLFLASGRVVHEAGGGEAAELAFALAATLSYAKALVAAGLPMDRAFAGIVLGLSADADYFLTIAKLRAARVLWARMTSACGVTAPAKIEARSSVRMLTAEDAWTNMLRLSAAGVGAALGGADAVILGTFTDALGQPTAFARRQTRNAQLVLMEEAHLGRVSDPAAGSGYIEALTDELARAAWTKFQAIEAQGGLLAALTTGLVANDIAQTCAARHASGQPKIVGVTAFPPLKADAVEIDHPTARPANAPSPRLPGLDDQCPPLIPIRLAQAYEAAQ